MGQVAIAFGVLRWGVLRGSRLVPTGGRSNVILDGAASLLGDVLRGAVAPLGAFCLGQDGSAPVSIQTGLIGEHTRLAIPAPGTNTANQANVFVGNTMTIRQSFTNLPLTVREGGLAGAIASPPGALNTGRYLNRALLGPLASSATDTYWVEFNITFNDTGGMQEMTTKATSSVTAGATTVTLAIASFVTSSAVHVEPNWNTTWWRDTTFNVAGQVKVNFGTAAPAGAQIQYTPVI